ncbi:MAG: AAA family ATPase [Phycisphaerales bacterium]
MARPNEQFPQDALVEVLNDVCATALDESKFLCVNQTHWGVKVVHVLRSLLDVERGDLEFVFRASGANRVEFAAALDGQLAALPRGCGAPRPSLYPEVTEWIARAWSLASLVFRSPRVRSSHLLLAALEDPALHEQFVRAWRPLAGIAANELREGLADICSGSCEETGAPVAAETADGTGKSPAAPLGRSGAALTRFGTDLTALARSGKLDPVRGRHHEIQELVGILLRQGRNNAILVGDAGTGKTAIVEGLAQGIAKGDLPDLKDFALISVDLGALQAGASVKGEFEDRIAKLVQEVKSSSVPIILFVDETHMLVGAGGTEGKADAANLLKPALARGELRMIGATTWREYRKYFLEDQALQRRFDAVRVNEPDDDQAIDMLIGLIPRLETHHGVRVTMDAVDAAVRLSRRHLSGRKLPDKARSLLDDACAMVRQSASDSRPAALREAEGRASAIRARAERLFAEAKIDPALAPVAAKVASEAERLETLGSEMRERWQRGVAKARRIREIEQFLKLDESGAESRAQLLDERGRLVDELRASSAGDPVFYRSVDRGVVAEVLSLRTGVPIANLKSDEGKDIARTLVEFLPDVLSRRVIGQRDSLAEIVEALQTSLRLGDSQTPVTLFCAGPSGVGKTETARAISEALFGNDQALLMLNMSEYQDKESINQFIGPPPGFVGFGQGGILTERIRQRPFSLILLDEFEKADEKVKDFMLGAFENGMVRDGAGEEFDCRSCIFMLTSNAGSEKILDWCKDAETKPNRSALRDGVKTELRKHFKPELIGRFERVVVFEPLSMETISDIAKLQVGRVARRIQASTGATIDVAREVVESLAAKQFDPGLGARTIREAVRATIEYPVVRAILQEEARGGSVTRVSVSPDGDGRFRVELTTA